MQSTDEFAWLSLLQRRADHVRKAAAGARTPGAKEELEELATLYDDIAGRAAADAEAPPERRTVTVEDAKSELIRHLQLRSQEFLSKARGQSDPKRADELRFLSGAYGAEAARLKHDTIR